jgi:hypothetical protein
MRPAKLSRAALVALVAAGASLPAAARAQCETDTDCRYGRVCQEGRCTYPANACERDVECPEGAICESGRCVIAAPAADEAAAAAQQVLPPPRPAVIRGLRPRRTDGGARFVDPIEWGGRGAISPRPHGTSTFELQYGNGQIPCGAGGELTQTNSVQLTLGGDSIVGNIVSIGFSMALFRWVGQEDCGADAGAYSLGDVQMRLGVLAYRNSGPNHWFGLSPFVRILMSSGSLGLGSGAAYYAILEPGVAVGFSYGMFSASLHLAGVVGFEIEDTLGGFNSHLSFGLRPIDLLGIVVDLEVGYGLPGLPEAVPVAFAAGLRLFLGQTIALDISSRIAITEEARYSDNNAAYGLWALGVRLAIVWRGLGRP